MRKMFKFIPILILLCLICGCGAGEKMEDSISNNFAPSSGVNKEHDDYYGSSDSISPEKGEISGDVLQEKLVYTCNLEIETLEYDKTLSVIKQKINEFNGIIESEKEYNHNNYWYDNESKDRMVISMKIRIPSEHYQEFLNNIDGQGKVVSKSSNVDNISKKYYETASLIESLEIQEKRLLEMMNKSESIQDMISVEARLTEVQSQLNAYKTSLDLMNSQVEYSTINIQLNEVVKYTPVEDTFFDRLSNTVSDAWESFWDILEGLLFFVIRSIPVLVIISPIIIVVIIKIKKYKKHKNISKTDN